MFFLSVFKDYSFDFVILRHFFLG